MMREDKEKFFEKFKEFLKKPQIKNVLLGMLTVIIGAICSSLGSWENINRTFWIKLGWAIGLSVIYIILLVFYSTNEVNERRIKGILENQIKAFETVMVGIISVCKKSAGDVNTIIHSIIDEGTLDLKIWNFDKACAWVCGEIYTLLGDLSGGCKDFGVAYVKLDEGKKPETEIQMNAFANQNMHTPSVYKEKRRIDEEDERDYHDVELFKRGKSDIEVLIGKEKIDEVFSYKSKSSRIQNKDRYNQYIAIPVFCNDIKMVGLLEVVCFNEASLGITKREVTELASKYLVPYSYLMLLLHKLEKALIAQPEK